MTDIERIIATIKDYQDKNLSLEDLQSYFQTLPLCLYFSAQQIEELEEQLETIRFLISDEMQHETVIHYLKPMKNYLESLRSSKIVPLIENLITGKDISIENAQHIEVLLDDYYENDEVIQDFITDLALYKGYTQKEIVKKFCESNLKQIKDKEKNEELPPKTQELKSSLLDIHKFACE